MRTDQYEPHNMAGRISRRQYSKSAGIFQRNKMYLAMSSASEKPEYCRTIYRPCRAEKHRSLSSSPFMQARQCSAPPPSLSLPPLCTTAGRLWEICAIFRESPKIPLQFLCKNAKIKGKPRTKIPRDVLHSSMTAAAAEPKFHTHTHNRVREKRGEEDNV